MKLPKKPQTMLGRQLKAHARFFIAVLFGLSVWALSFAAPVKLGGVTHFLIGWNAGIWLFLILALWMMAHATLAGLKKRAGMEDEGRAATLGLVTAGTVVAVVALGFELADALRPEAACAIFRISLALAAIFGSWLFVNFSFALHYAHEVYRTRLSVNSLGFPNEKQPDYWDFLYFAMVVGTTFQTSDVEIRSRTLRRTAMVQGLVAFLFNTAIIALTVSVASQLFGK
ncbi:MAG: DUF1345 domain-containing protein [Xanthobacteraceae bacterium]|nr:DUF1345 domain-containing protein [Xanthobacteraceae bacterium]MBX3550611.1 DUF1345 domain-containing protein [Xanthobacteraceae bacterium]